MSWQGRRDKCSATLPPPFSSVWEGDGGFDKRDCPYGQKLVEATSNMAMFSAYCIMKGRCQFSYHLKEDFIIELLNGHSLYWE